MGQNIGTTVTALLSSVGTNKNAKRAAVVHLMFNVIGVVVLLTVFCIVKAVFAPAILNESATMYGIAIAHSLFNILCTAMLLPAGNILEKLAIRMVPDVTHKEEAAVELDERLLATPSLALRQCRAVANDMAECAVRALENALTTFTHYTPVLADSIRADEDRCDHYEDVIGTYLVKLSAQKMGEAESEEATELLKTIGDFERISDHAVNAEGGNAHPPHPADAAGPVQHRSRLRLVGSADGSGAHLRPLLQYRRVRHRRRPAQPEPSRNAPRHPPKRRQLPAPLPFLSGSLFLTYSSIHVNVKRPAASKAQAFHVVLIKIL